MSQSATMQKKNVNSPDETRTFGQGKMDVVNVGGATIGRVIFEPGWKWSEHVKPIAGTDSCEVEHLGYVVSGRLKTVMNDGTEAEFGPGDVVAIPPGHDGWVIGDEPVEYLELAGAATYAKE